jgi:hypothetical protein
LCRFGIRRVRRERRFVAPVKRHNTHALDRLRDVARQLPLLRERRDLLFHRLDVLAQDGHDVGVLRERHAHLVPQRERHAGEAGAPRAELDHALSLEARSVRGRAVAAFAELAERDAAFDFERETQASGPKPASQDLRLPQAQRDPAHRHRGESLRVVVHRVFERGLGQAIAAEIELHRGTGRASARCRSKRATTSNVTRDATRVRLCASPRGGASEDLPRGKTHTFLGREDLFDSAALTCDVRRNAFRLECGVI